MANTIKLKRSNTSGDTPTTAQMDLGEIAVNTYDGKLFIRGNNGSDFVNEITSITQGGGSNADTLDNLDSSQFLRSDADDTATGNINFTGNLTKDNNTVWHAGNDGSGSGLDADLLDGQHASAFLTTTNFELKVCHLKTNQSTAMAEGPSNEFTVNFNLESHNDSSFFSHSNGVITVLETGWYRVYANMVYQNASSSVRTTVRAFIKKNGTTIDSTTTFDYDRGSSFGEFSNNKIETVLYLTANDTLEIANYAENEDGNASIEADMCEFIVTRETSTGSTTNADTVDGLQASQFLRSDANDGANGQINLYGTTPFLFAPTAEGMSYNATENGGNANGRYFLRFDRTNNASYPYLTNRTPSGDVAVFTGGATAGTENEIIRFKGGNGTRAIELTNSYFDMGTNDITDTKVGQWDTAYGWGDHSTQGYLTSYSETDTLDSVTDRGATTTNDVTVGKFTASTTNDGTWTKPLAALVTNLGNGQNAQFTFGKALNNNNLVEFSHHHTSDGSSNNHMTIGYYGNTNRFALRADGKVSIGTAYNSPVFTESFNVTGNISVTGNVDGRDVSADGTKLDGIESGATADQSASEILTAIKTVDGSGSGLDADTLDGIQASAFVQSLSDLSITSTAAELNILDVSTQSPTDGQALTYSTANGLEWGSVASDSPFVENDQTISTSYTVASGKNAQGIGPITISNGAIITVSTGSKLVIT